MKTEGIADYECERRRENLDRAVAAEREAADLRARLAAAEAREARLREQMGWAAAALGAAASHMATMPMPTEACRTETLRMIRRCDDVEAACRALTARAALTADGAALAAAIEGVLTSGNHLASHLGQKHPPHDATDDDALAYYGAGWRYDAWTAWSRIMRLRAVWRRA